MEGNSLQMLDDVKACMSEDRCKTILLERTRSGRPAKFESGGATSSTVGSAVLVCGPHGEKMLPTYTRKAGPRANGEHGLFVVFPGALIVEAIRGITGCTISVFKIKEILEKEGKCEALAVKILECDGGVWDRVHLRERFADVIAAAKRKTNCYHCREVHYGLEMRQLDPRLKDLADSLKSGAEKAGAQNVSVSFDNPDPDVLVTVELDLPETEGGNGSDA